MNDSFSMTKRKRKPIPLPIKIAYLIILGLIVWQSFIYVSPIKGKVVDAETGKPMEGVNVRAGWVTGYINPAGGSFRTFKVYATKTNANGEFMLPRSIKLKIPIIENYQGENILIYIHGYSALYKETTGNASYLSTGYYIQKIYGHLIDVKLPRLKSDEEYLRNVKEIGLWMSGGDHQFIISERRAFSETFPQSTLLDENQLMLAGYYEVQLKDYNSAIREYEKLIKEYPNSRFVPSVKKDIEELRGKIKP